ncbi:DUF4184 family protein [Leptothoe sp. PORK10 BA2]|uniref:DUF4184 family protein n=1 Tax=Leptothoe sp. PORK10 BA2 TaxID=3110254 RepID=UPI002B1FFDD8|nr:DUF4184 family protein [Leptothoe sp. PORK10 BA2]MEA5466073.1 DUF4184 family protein [Leptothoe sp. PORK10 BA2]
MPFTISHAAAIIPFNRRPFILSALITGSMSPDFLYFIPGIPNQAITHTLPGLLIFCLPASLAVLLLYHHWLQQPLQSLLPRSIRLRLPGHSFNPSWPWIVVSILIGAFTHIFWDSFTHSYGQGVKLLPILEQPVITVAGETLLFYKLLQYLSTILGGLVVIVWAAQWLWQQPPQETPMVTERSNPLLLVLITISSSLLGLVYGLLYYPVGGFKGFAVQAVIVTMSGFCGLLGLYAVAWHVHHRR